MSLVIDGEIDKMSVLYEKYKMPLYYYFYKTTFGDRETSEDMVHTVFYRAIRYRNSFTGQGSFGKWIFRIAHNVCLDNKVKLKKSYNYATEVKSGFVALADENESNIEKSERLSILDAAMKKLEPDEREIIILGKIECLRYKEIAGILGTTEGNVKIRMFRAIRKLKDIFFKIENISYEKEKSGRKSS